jgi:translocator protein
MITIKAVMGLVAWLAVSFVAAWIGSRFMPGEWYVSLVKPSWNPPNWVFAPVWSVLYILMGVAAWLVWRQAGFTGFGGVALRLFIVQLALNALWSHLFFGLHRPDLAFLDIVGLWVAILAVVLMFWRVNAVAGTLMLPYLAWVGFASYLNYVIWRLNAGPL